MLLPGVPHPRAAGRAGGGDCSNLPAIFMKCTFAALLLLAAAAPPAPAASGAPPAAIRVFAAASLGDVFRDLARGFEARVELNLAGTQVLRLQIEQGAAADVYAFADVADAEALAARNLVQPPRVFARNVLCVIAPASSTRVAALADLARPGVKIVMGADTVPAGRYALQALEKMEKDGGFGPGFGPGVRANVVSKEANVRLVLAKVALGEADAGFVYASDAAGNRQVKAIAIPDALNVVGRYGVGVVSKTPPPAAVAFVEAVLGAPGQDRLRAHGFLAP
jgi:molybdate transport system substrate-binding protein